MKWIILLSLSLWVQISNTQTPAVFLESGNVLGVANKNAALAKAIVDFNGDFRDDILTMDRDSIYLEIQLNDGQLYKKTFTHPTDKGPFTINAGDFNNDGLNDFLHSGFYNDINIFHNEGEFQFKSMPPTGESVFAQGSSLFDINNDGWLDALITHDDGASIVLINDGQGNLIREELIDFTTVPASDNSGNYSAIWVDLNQDDVLDLYIAKCRVGADEPTDPRRINMAYINNNGVFTEVAEEMNLAIGDQSWCVDSGDLDNDGDMDMILINHEAPHKLLENKGDGTFEHHIDFTNRAPFTTYDLEVAIQDFNNDGWQDVLIGGTKDYLLINEGNLQFRRYDNPFGSKNASSFGIGDLNSDGYLDAYISFGGPDVPSVIADETWLNFGGFNNHFKCTLQGVQSNASGIGSKIELYGPWGRQVKWLNSGTAYGITNSLTMHFGLDAATRIDSCIITWPSGLIDKYFDLDYNIHYTAVEGVCIEPVIQLGYSKLELSCEDDIIEFINTSGEQVRFSNGTEDSKLDLNQEGIIFATSLNEECYNSSGTFLISRIPSLVEPVLNYTGDIVLCEGDILRLESNISTPIEWQDGSSTMSFAVNEAGEYYIINANECDTLQSELLNAEYIQLLYKDSLIVLEEIEDVSLFVDGENVEWFSDPMGENSIAQTGELYLPMVSSDTTVYYQVSGDRNIPSSIGGEQLSEITAEYSPENINAIMLIDILEAAVIETFEVETDSAGVRMFLVLEEGDTIYRNEVNLVKGINEIVFNLELMPGSYTITTDRNVNMNSFGYFGPRLVSHSGNPVEYPFFVNNLIRINSSGFGNGFYYYLYNLKAKPLFEECRSELFKFEIMLDTTTSLYDIERLKHAVKVFPNPTNEIITITSDSYVMMEYTISDIAGNIVMRKYNIGSNHDNINLSHLPQGLYILKLETNRGLIRKRVIKQ